LSTILGHTERIDEDQLYVDAPPYRPRPVTEMIPADPVAERLAQLPTRLDVWRAALLGTLTGAAIVIAWIEVIHRVCL
jgi:trans-aconitate methyltransferase